MKILTVAGLFPPHAFGGAEASAASLAKWLGRQGHESCVLTAATCLEDVRCDRSGELETWYEYFPRPYPVSIFPKAPRYKKPLWHLQDNFDPRNSGILERTVQKIKPDVV